MNPVWHFLNGVPTGGKIAPSVVLTGDGSASLPSYSFAGDPDTGLYLFGANQMAMTFAGSPTITFSGTSLTLGTDTVTLRFGANADVVLSRAAADVLTTPDRFVSTGPGAGIGYATGAGGTQTQGTSKSTTVVLNTITGEVTMHNATLNAATAVSFTLTNSAVATGDYVLVQHISAGTLGAYVCQAIAGSGSATVTVTNRSAGNLGEAIVLKYMVFKSATA